MSNQLNSRQQHFANIVLILFASGMAVPSRTYRDGAECAPFYEQNLIMSAHYTILAVSVAVKYDTIFIHLALDLHKVPLVRLSC